MNLGTIRQEVLDHGFDANVFTGRINQYINDAQNDIARRVNYYNDEGAYDVSTVAGTSNYAFPTDFARARALRDTSRNAELFAVSIRDIDRSSAKQGVPVYYAIDGAFVHVYPTPDGVYPLELRYWKMPAQLVNDNDVPSLPTDYHTMLWVFAVWRCYEGEDDPNMAQYWKGRFDNELAQFSADQKFPNVDMPKQARGMWDDDSPLTPAGSWSLWGY